MTEPARTVVIALDAFDSALARKLAAEGRLPAIAELLAPRARRTARRPLAAAARRAAARRGLTAWWADGDEHEWSAQRWYLAPNNTVYGGVRINVRGREPNGLVEPADLDRVCDGLAADLLDLVNVDTGEPVINRVTRTGPSRRCAASTSARRSRPGSGSSSRASTGSRSPGGPKHRSRRDSDAPVGGDRNRCMFPAGRHGCVARLLASMTHYLPGKRVREDRMKRTRVWLLVGILALLVGAFAVAGCGGDDDDEGDGEPAAGQDFGLLEEGQLLVGIDTPFPPFEQGQPPDVTGYDVDVTNAVAEELGLEITYQDTSFDTIFRDVAQGRFDMAVAATTITPGREKTVDFSDPYYEAQQALVVTPDADIASVDDLSGAIVGAQDGTTGEAYANDETEASEVRGFPEGPDAINALRAGQVDATIIDQPVAVDAMEKQGGLEIVEEIPTNELYGLYFAPDNDALREAVNEALATIKEDGRLTEFYDTYFNTEPPASVLEGTHEPT